MDRLLPAWFKPPILGSVAAAGGWGGIGLGLRYGLGLPADSVWVVSTRVAVGWLVVFAVVFALARIVVAASALSPPTWEYRPAPDRGAANGRPKVRWKLAWIQLVSPAAILYSTSLLGSPPWWGVYVVVGIAAASVLSFLLATALIEYVDPRPPSRGWVLDWRTARGTDPGSSPGG